MSIEHGNHIAGLISYALGIFDSTCTFLVPQRLEDVSKFSLRCRRLCVKHVGRMWKAGYTANLHKQPTNKWPNVQIMIRNIDSIMQRGDYKRCRGTLTGINYEKQRWPNSESQRCRWLLASAGQAANQASRAISRSLSSDPAYASRDALSSRLQAEQCCLKAFDAFNASTQARRSVVAKVCIINTRR